MHKAVMSGEAGRQRGEGEEGRTREESHHVEVWWGGGGSDSQEEIERDRKGVWT